MTAEWSVGKRLAFRFLFIYLVLYCLERYLEGTGVLEPIEGLIFAAGRLLSVDATRRASGSGDQMYYYIQSLCFLLTALLATLVWPAFDLPRPNDRKLYLGLRVLVRITLGYMLISYGAAKLFAAQMPLPDERRLLETFGNASPMGLLWAFMGASPAYQSFTGAIELLSGILLFFRRTTLLGSLLTIVAMTQVVALNLAYDVPVKLASMHYLAMAVFLAADEGRRLVNVLLLNRPTVPAPMETILQKPLLLRGALALKLLFLMGAVGWQLFFSYGLMLQYASAPDSQKYPLLNRGFHWVSEIPFNR